MYLHSSSSFNVHLFSLFPVHILLHFPVISIRLCPAIIFSFFYRANVYQLIPRQTRLSHSSPIQFHYFRSRLFLSVSLQSRLAVIMTVPHLYLAFIPSPFLLPLIRHTSKSVPRSKPCSKGLCACTLFSSLTNKLKGRDNP